ESGQNMVLYFRRIPSPRCARFERETLTDPEVRQAMNNMVSVRIDADIQPGLADEFRVRYLPALVMVAPDGRILARRDGLTDVAGTLLMLRQKLPPRRNEEVRQSLEILQQDKISALQWLNIVRIAGRDYNSGRTLRDAIAVRKPYPAAPLVKLLRHPLLSIRSCAFEMLTARSGRDFHFDPWQKPDTPANLAALGRWDVWLRSSRDAAGSGPIMNSEHAAALINQLVEGEDNYSVMAVEQLLDCGDSALALVRDYARRHPKLPPEPRRRLRELEYALLLPHNILPSPVVVAHHLLFGTIDQRQQAVLLLGNYPEALPILTECLNDGEALVRETAVEAITKQNDRRIGKIIEQHLRHEKDKGVIFAIIRGLARICTQRSVDILCRYLQSPNEDNVIAALTSLKAMRAHTAGKEIIACLNDSRWRVQAAALDAVADIDLTAAGPPAMKLMESPDEFVAIKAIGTTAGIKYAGALKLLPRLFAKNDRLKMAVIHAYCRMEVPIPDGIIKDLKREKEEFLLALAPELAGCNEYALPAGIFLSRQSNPDIFLPAAKYLGGEMEHPEAVAALVVLLNRVAGADAVTIIEKCDFRVQPFREAMKKLQSNISLTEVSTVKLDELADAFGLDAEGGTGKNGASDSSPASGAPGSNVLRLESAYRDFLLCLQQLFRREKKVQYKQKFGIALLQLNDPAALSYIAGRFAALSEADQLSILNIIKSSSEQPDIALILKTALHSPQQYISAAAVGIIMRSRMSSLKEELVRELERPRLSLSIIRILDKSFSYERSFTLGPLRPWCEKTLSGADKDWQRRVLALFMLFVDWRRPDTEYFVRAAASEHIWEKKVGLQLLAYLDFPRFKTLVPALAASVDPQWRRFLLAVLQQNNSSVEINWNFGTAETVTINITNERRSVGWTSHLIGFDDKGKIDPELLPVVKKLAGDSDPAVRLYALSTLAIGKEKVDYYKLGQLLVAVSEEERSRLLDRLNYAWENDRLPPEMKELLPFIPSEDREMWAGKFPKVGKRKIAVALRSDSAATTATTATVTAATAAEKREKTVVAAPANSRVVVYFYKNGCADCRAVEKMLRDLQQAIPGMEIRSYNIDSAASLRLNEAYGEKFHVPVGSRLLAPAVFTGAGALVKDRIKRAELQRLLSRPEAAVASWLISPPRHEPQKKLAASDRRIKERYTRIRWPLILAAGFLDGINPCAFAAIIFFISYLAIARRSRGEILRVGLAFAFGMFLAYYLMGLGLAEVMSRISFFHVAGVWLNRIMAGIVFILAGFSIYDGIMCRLGRGREMKLQLSDHLKNGIHRTIRTGARQARFVVAAFLVGAVVAALELACTGQVYAPVILYVIKTDSRRYGALWYLVVYNLAFVTPLLIITLATVFGMGHMALTLWLRRHAATVKFATALLFLVLGVVLWHGAV
ncbi:MAG: cytochrome c biogenesis protein CcdA, partial [Victivallales bacterium]|nr:cytochrome c biogenesis protein CcdA [Victivallales bacterium]